MITRAILVLNLAKVPSDILARVREDILGTGVHAQVASVLGFDEEKGVITVGAELLTGDSFEGNPTDVVQAALDELYGAVEADAEESDEPESGEPSGTEKSSPKRTRKPRAPKEVPATEPSEPSTTEESTETSSPKTTE